jgi:predicted dehydrogenase
MILNPFAMKVVLFGLGQWSKKSWLPILLTLSRWGVIDLTVVDRWPLAPAELFDFVREGVCTYLPWENCFEAGVVPPWNVAFVVTSANAQYEVTSCLVKQAPNLRVIVCEKPCGTSLEEANSMYEVCRHAQVTLMMADHYLLRPPIQHLIAFPNLLCSMGEIVSIRAALNEFKPSGPNQGVTADLMIHLIDLLFALFPNASFVPSTACIARVQERAHTAEETYSFCCGSLLIAGRPPIRCELECGKQIAADRKELHLIGKDGELYLDLYRNSLKVTRDNVDSGEVSFKWTHEWSYAPLVLRCLSLNSLATASSTPTQ